MALFNFDDSQDQLQQNLEALPPGWYPAAMIGSDIVPTSKADGFRLAVTFEIIDGPGKGRKQKAGFNIDNPNAETTRIGRSEVKTMKTCMGIFSPVQMTE